MSGEDETNKGPDKLITNVGIHDIGERLIDLGQQLVAIGEHTDSAKFRDDIRAADEIGVDEVWESVGRQMDAAIRRTLSGLGSFRREYGNWERLVVEYAIDRRGFTQRDVAVLLGVGHSTVNRWTQQPLTYDE